MQTLKTSAIVVLLVTVMYAAYVSITTPPQQVSPEMDDLILAIDDGMSIDGMNIDVGLPDSLGDFDTGDFANSFVDSGVSGSINDQTSSLEGAGGGFEIAMNDRDSSGAKTGRVNDSSTATTAIGLPPSNGRPANVRLDPNRSYASTGREFAMPTADEAAGALSGNPLAGNSNSSAPIWTNQAKPDSTSTSNADRSSTFDLAGPGLAGDTNENGPTKNNSGSPDNLQSNPMFDLANADRDSNDSGTANLPDALPSNDSASGDSDLQAAQANLGLANAIRMADAQYAEDQKKQALSTLSLFYETPNLSDENRAALLGRLDPLAREVIYSRDHLLEQPHRVRQSETLMQVATQYEVPWQLLANINGINDPITVLPGTDLKVVRGPFRADVNIGRDELTLFVGDLYAGRFPIAVGADPSPKPGTFTVLDKQRARTYYDANGAPVPPGSANNPYGSMWLDLGGQLCIHGSPKTDEPTRSGCISLAERYAGDLYGILSQGSTVTIRR